jgi:GntR family transcriptional regulator, trigonelline degradation regulator
MTGASETAELSTIARVDRAAAPLRHRVLDTLRNSIVRGQIAPGTRLVERELVTMLGVSRTVLRESLRQLESEGLIDVVPNKGAVVRGLSVAEANDIYAIRAVLEGLAARLFTENAGPVQITALREALERTVGAYGRGDPEDIIQTKTAFYEVLFRGAGSDILYTMIEALHARVWRWRVLGLAHPQRSSARSTQSLNALGRILAAIEQGRGDEAEQIARDEVTQAAAEAIRLLGGADPAEAAE